MGSSETLAVACKIRIDIDIDTYYLVKVLLRISELGMLPMPTAAAACTAASGSLRAWQHFFRIENPTTESKMAASDVLAWMPLGDCRGDDATRRDVATVRGP